jgi:hypothetical protein
VAGTKLIEFATCATDENEALRDADAHEDEVEDPPPGAHEADIAV